MIHNQPRMFLKHQLSPFTYIAKDEPEEREQWNKVIKKVNGDFNIICNTVVCKNISCRLLKAGIRDL